MTEITQAFREANLPLPKVPQRWAGELRKVDEWLYATLAAPSDVPMYRIDAFEQMARAAEVDEGLLIGHQGYGTNNWALHYYLIQSALVILLQMPWGGAYQDSEECLARIRSIFDQLDVFLTRFESVGEQQLTSDRLVIVQSHLTPSRWGTVSMETSAKGDSLLEPRWNYDESPLDAATKDLQGRRTSPAG